MRTIVVGNEKGGAGKSTIAIHLATALLHGGARLATLDLDLRQQSLARFFANRRAWMAAEGVEAPMPIELSNAGLDAEGMKTATEQLVGQADLLLIDTPGADTPLARAAHSLADVIVTPMNDSFVDFDVLGQVDPVTLDLVKPSFYAEAVWEARKQRMAAGGRSIDWVVLRNRLAPMEARNRRRVDDRLAALAKRVGFRVGPGLRDRVIYRELFPFGLTVADLSPTVRPVAVSLSHVAARQELRAVMSAVRVGEFAREAPVAAE